MEETYSTKAIIIDRGSFREKDSRVKAYSKDKGKLSLVVRGTKSLKSKLCGHIEPFNAVEIMVVRGKHYDYLAGASTRQAFLVLKSDLDRLRFAGQGIKLLNELVAEEERDDNIYLLLFAFLEELDKDEVALQRLQLVYSTFLLKLYSYLGYSPVFDRCVACGKVAIGSSFLFDHKRGGIVCTPCAHGSSETIQITSDTKKMLQYMQKSQADDFIDAPLFEAQISEMATVIDFFIKYHKPF